MSQSGCEKQAPPGADAAAPAPQSLRVIKMTLAGRPFDIEVADDQHSQEIGLMYRDSMPMEHGMIFVFDDEIPRSFWMKNTRIPLDIIYLDHAGTIVSIKSMRPLDLTSVPSDLPAKYAIELNGGVVQALGLKAGDRIDLPAALHSPAR